MSATASRPAGRSTRAASANTRFFSGDRLMKPFEIAQSKLSSATGGLSIHPSRNPVKLADLGLQLLNVQHSHDRLLCCLAEETFRRCAALHPRRMQYEGLGTRLRGVALVGVARGGTVEGSRADRGESFRALAREQLPRLYSIARRLVGDDAEDAVQDCLLKAFQRFDQLKQPAAGPAWLTSILVNCCRDRGRARARRPDEIDFDQVEEFSLYRKIAYEDPFPYSDSLHLDFLDEFGPEDVRAVLMRLPERYRVPLVLVYMDGYLAKEVAGMLDAPLGTVLARLHRGRKLFEKQMWDYAEESGLLRKERRADISEEGAR